MSNQAKNDKGNILYVIPIIKSIFKKMRFFNTVRENIKLQHEESDPKENAKTIPPDSEKIELHCSWVAEAYTPSNIVNLIKSLKRLGWDKPEKEIGDTKSLTEQIKQYRGFGNGGSWINGGFILSRNDTRFPEADVRRAKLPKGVDFASLSIRNITPSLTLVIIQFIYNDEINDAISNIYNKSYSTKVKYKPSILKTSTACYVGVVGQKRRALKKKIDATHAELYAWFNKNLPGYYSLSVAGALTTVDLITSRLYEQDEENDTHHRDHYTNLLFDYAAEIWRCKNNRALEFRIPWHSTKKATATLFGNYDKLMQNTNEYGGTDRLGLTNKFNDLLDSFVSLLATHELLLSYEQQLSAIRDRATFHIKGANNAIKNLETIRNNYLAISTDAQTISNDVAALAKAKKRYYYEDIDFEPPHYFKNNNYPSLAELLRQQAELRTEQLVKLESRVNQAITISGNLISSIANLRVQRSVCLFTFIVVLLTIFSVFFRDPVLIEIQQQLKRLNELIILILKKI